MFTRRPGRCVFRWSAFIVAFILLFALAVMTHPAQGQPPGSGASVPFNFSHKKHAATRVPCEFCHETAQTGVKATFPAEQKCMVCHRSVKTDSEAIKQLAAIAPDSRVVPEKPLYKLPEFVYFSHARHAGAKIECAQCHGDVFSMDVVELHLPMHMKACVDCHRASKAPAACTTCHESFQQ